LVCVLLIVLAFLMISTIRYPSFKDADLRKPLPRSAVVGTAMLLVLVFFFSDEVLVLLAVLYSASGPVGRGIPAVRKFLTGGSHGRSGPSHADPGSSMADGDGQSDATT
jgi:phosphatidylserine synthase